MTARTISLMAALGKAAAAVRKETPVSRTVPPAAGPAALDGPRPSSQQPHRYGVTRRKPYSGAMERDST